MMESARKCFLLLLTISLTIDLSRCETRYYVKMPTNATANQPRGIIGDQETSEGRINRAISNPEKSRSMFRIDDATMIRESLKASHERRNSFLESSTFDPDVLNKFLDDYANKIKSTTEKNYNFPFRVGIPEGQKVNGERGDNNRGEIISLGNEGETEANMTTESSINSTVETTGISQQDLNDTIKRNKYFGANNNEDDRNGWVTLEAIPWSKSKISKWQASSSSQRPWPDMKVWDKPNGGKPWNSEYPSRPAYINNEPWHDAPKPLRPDYQSERPSMRPQVSTRPSYFDDRFDDNPNQAQKWPPERPQSSWEKFPSADSYRPNIEIITDDRPSNFPTNNFDKYSHTSTINKKPTYGYNDRYTGNDNYDNNNHHQGMNNDWREPPNDYPSKFENYKEKPTNFGRPDHHQQNNNHPQHMSHYQYTPHHPPSHPSNGDGQWVLLSTNRGYSKSRQRSIKIDAINGDGLDFDKTRLTNGTTIPARTTKQDNDGSIAVMTSKRQVRLTVLPSINGTNTTTSHGGLLEVEKTFKTVDQSQREYEQASKLLLNKPTMINNRPIRNTIISSRPSSNSAVLAAVSAGMVPATMAMMIPMMLGRKKRSSYFPISRRFDSIGNHDYRMKFH